MCLVAPVLHYMRLHLQIFDDDVGEDWLIGETIDVKDDLRGISLEGLRQGETMYAHAAMWRPDDEDSNGVPFVHDFLNLRLTSKHLPTRKKCSTTIRLCG